jgi:hypothetical protein
VHDISAAAGLSPRPRACCAAKATLPCKKRKPSSVAPTTKINQQPFLSFFFNTLKAFKIPPSAPFTGNVHDLSDGRSPGSVGDFACRPVRKFPYPDA